MHKGQLSFWDAPPAPAPAPFAMPEVSQGRTFTFYLGIHRPQWLFDRAMRSVPLFLSYRQMAALQDRRALAPAATSWCLDSGGFMELSKHGRWTVDARRYATAVQRFRREVGGLRWAAVMDWMTEPAILKKTGASCELHQSRTIDSYIELRSLAPEVPWAPVLQGWAVGDHERHLDEYLRRGIDLTEAPIVGVGSVCRRSETMRAAGFLADLAAAGLSLHAFGYKTSGLRQIVGAVRPFGIDPLPFRDPAVGRYASVPLWTLLRSADSMAWSLSARMEQGGLGCTHKSCQNCALFARHWRHELLTKLARSAEEQFPESGLPRWPEITLE